MIGTVMSEAEHDLEQPFPRPVSGDPVVNAPSGLVPSRSVLSGNLTRLEPLDPAVHAQELYRAGHGSAEALRIWDYLPHGPWSDEASFMAHLRNQAADLDQIRFVVRPAATGVASGMASYMDINPKDGVIEIGGIWFSPNLQRTRAATEALFLLLSYAMDELRYRRMQWRCNSLNVKSRNAARRLGFRFEGVFYNHQISKGRNRDTAWYSILDDEWPDVRANIERWLHDDNFDPGGKARSSLTEMMQAGRTPSTRQQRPQADRSSVCS
jgi:RimJ/RimL family protein N-acetyltransferase